MAEPARDGGETPEAAGGRDYDVVVVGAGVGGVYAIHRFRQQGLSVLGLESAGGVGGVWFHNRYPGARVDIQTTEYCYFFSPEIFREWRWSERYAAQPELLRYINFVADRLEIRPHIRLNTTMTGARWNPARARYDVEAEGENGHLRVAARFLVMATGNLSDARKPDFDGLDDFEGEWVQTAKWPERPVAVEGRRIGVVGTGSTGVQVITALAPKASHLYVFQRHANYSVPAQNGPLDLDAYEAAAADVAGTRARLFETRAGFLSKLDAPKRAQDYTEAERLARLEQQWRNGGQGMSGVFSDLRTDAAANEIVAEFVRNKIRSIVQDPAIAEKLCPKDHPLGSRRLCLDTGYYEVFNRPNVTLVDVAHDPILRVTRHGIATRDNHYGLDLIVFALGFHAFTGAIDKANIRNEKGLSPTDRWKRGPRTLLGLMTVGFPNLFIATGPGSPATLANLILMNEHHMDWIAGCIRHMDAHGYRTVEPDEQAEAEWTRHVAEIGGQLLRLKIKNYMVHVNEDDDTRTFIPYAGGLKAYTEISNRIAAEGYRGFVFN